MDKFQENEEKGRLLMEELLKSIGVRERDMFRSIGKMNPVDFFFIHNKRKFCVEIKVRDSKFSSSNTHFLELKKAEAMEEERVRNECSDAIYVNFFGSDSAVIYNIRDTRSYKLTEVYCNKYTSAESGKVKKKIIECPANRGMWLKKVNNTWIVVNWLDYVDFFL